VGPAGLGVARHTYIGPRALRFAHDDRHSGVDIAAVQASFEGANLDTHEDLHGVPPTRGSTRGTPAASTDTQLR
jgi:hypothetical protein